MCVKKTFLLHNLFQLQICLSILSVNICLKILPPKKCRPFNYTTFLHTHVLITYYVKLSSCKYLYTHRLYTYIIYVCTCTTIYSHLKLFYTIFYSLSFMKQIFFIFNFVVHWLLYNLFYISICIDYVIYFRYNV